MAPSECNEPISFFLSFSLMLKNNIIRGDMKEYDYFIYTFSYYAHTRQYYVWFHSMGKQLPCLNSKSVSSKLKIQQKKICGQWRWRRQRRQRWWSYNTRTRPLEFRQFCVYLCALMTFPRARSIHAYLCLSRSAYSSYMCV